MPPSPGLHRMAPAADYIVDQIVDQTDDQSADQTSLCNTNVL
jgi:hypothetical protein